MADNSQANTNELRPLKWSQALDFDRKSIRNAIKHLLKIEKKYNKNWEHVDSVPDLKPFVSEIISDWYENLEGQDGNRSPAFQKYSEFLPVYEAGKRLFVVLNTLSHHCYIEQDACHKPKAEVDFELLTKLRELKLTKEKKEELYENLINNISSSPIDKFVVLQKAKEKSDYKLGSNNKSGSSIVELYNAILEDLHRPSNYFSNWYKKSRLEKLYKKHTGNKDFSAIDGYESLDSFKKIEILQNEVDKALLLKQLDPKRDSFSSLIKNQGLVGLHAFASVKIKLPRLQVARDVWSKITSYRFVRFVGAILKPVTWFLTLLKEFVVVAWRNLLVIPFVNEKWHHLLWAGLKRILPRYFPVSTFDKDLFEKRAYIRSALDFLDKNKNDLLANAVDEFEIKLKNLLDGHSSKLSSKEEFLDLYAKTYDELQAYFLASGFTSTCSVKVIDKQLYNDIKQYERVSGKKSEEVFYQIAQSNNYNLKAVYKEIAKERLKVTNKFQNEKYKRSAWAMTSGDWYLKDGVDKDIMELRNSFSNLEASMGLYSSFKQNPNTKIYEYSHDNTPAGLVEKIQDIWSTEDIEKLVNNSYEVFSYYANRCAIFDEGQIGSEVVDSAQVNFLKSLKVQLHRVADKYHQPHRIVNIKHSEKTVFSEKDTAKLREIKRALGFNDAFFILPDPNKQSEGDGSKVIYNDDFDLLRNELQKAKQHAEGQGFDKVYLRKIGEWDNYLRNLEENGKYYIQLQRVLSRRDARRKKKQRLAASNRVINMLVSLGEAGIGASMVVGMLGASGFGWPVIVVVAAAAAVFTFALISNNILFSRPGAEAQKYLLLNNAFTHDPDTNRKLGILPRLFIASTFGISVCSGITLGALSFTNNLPLWSSVFGAVVGLLHISALVPHAAVPIVTVAAVGMSAVLFIAAILAFQRMGVFAFIQIAKDLNKMIRPESKTIWAEFKDIVRGIGNKIGGYFVDTFTINSLFKGKTFKVVTWPEVIVFLARCIVKPSLDVLFLGVVVAACGLGGILFGALCQKNVADLMGKIAHIVWGANPNHVVFQYLSWAVTACSAVTDTSFDTLNFMEMLGNLFKGVRKSISNYITLNKRCLELAGIYKEALFTRKLSSTVSKHSKNINNYLYGQFKMTEPEPTNKTSDEYKAWQKKSDLLKGQLQRYRYMQVYKVTKFLNFFGIGATAVNVNTIGVGAEGATKIELKTAFWIASYIFRIFRLPFADSTINFIDQIITTADSAVSSWSSNMVAVADGASLSSAPRNDDDYSADGYAFNEKFNQSAEESQEDEDEVVSIDWLFNDSANEGQASLLIKLRDRDRRTNDRKFVEYKLDRINELASP